MDRPAAVRLIRNTFENSFDKGRFVDLARNLIKHLDESGNFSLQGNYIPDAYSQSIRSYDRVGKYDDADGRRIDVLVVRLRKEHALDRARSMQRNFVAWYLNGSRGGIPKDSALVAFVSPAEGNWRFSLVRMDYDLVAPGKIQTELTPARRYSFLVGEGESSHTAQVQLLPILEDDERKPRLSDFEKAFNIEVVTREFFQRYRELFHKVRDALEDELKRNDRAAEDFEANGVDTVSFSKKLLGQVVFLYFLQKKGWFGVGRDENWATGPRDFLRRLFDSKVAPYNNFFNDLLEPLFYEALALERAGDFYSRFNCKIPFLNGGLFDPMNNYDWVHTDILLDNELFSNSDGTKERDVGTGILDVFDRYNFTVKEDEPLEKDVAVDPEMLGKVFENLLEVKDRKSKGTYYTPREIVHYMCQESLINYLDTAINAGDVPLVATPPPQGRLLGKPDPEQAALTAPGYRGIVPREDIEALVRMGELAVEHDTRVEAYGRETERYSYKLPERVRWNAGLIDERLAAIRVCDPAIGSGAFPVGLMMEIVRARSTLTTYLPDKQGRTSYNFKRHAIQNCLYGVDIDPGAVEIAKLRLWLSMVVDEEDIKQIQPLPNLDYKIVCGNSLLGVKKDIFNLELFNELERLKLLYFDETSVTRKQEHKKQIDRLIRQITNDNETFDFEVYFSEVFHEKGGFDVVIANPPYVSVKAITGTDKEVLSRLYDVGEGRFNLFALFVERGHKILRDGGILTFILPEGIFSSIEYRHIRRYILENAAILLVNLFSGRVFEAAVDTSIISMMKKSPFDNEFTVSRDLNQTLVRMQQRLFETLPHCLFPVNVGLQSFPIISKLLHGDFDRVSDILEIQQGIIYSGQPKSKVFADSPVSNRHKPVLDGRDVLKWKVNWSKKKENKYIHYTNKLHRPREERLFLADEKVLLPRKSTNISCAYDTEKYYALNTAYLCLLANDQYSLKYILACLNSKLMNHFYSQLFFGWQVTIPALNILPIKRLSIPEQEACVDLVDLILAITRDEDYLTDSTKQAKVKELERQIDHLIYELYDLTPAEIAVVEGAVS